MLLTKHAAVYIQYEHQNTAHFKDEKNELDCSNSFFNFGVIDGARTHDNWNHNPGLYQLSYDHH